MKSKNSHSPNNNIYFSNNELLISDKPYNKTIQQKQKTHALNRYTLPLPVHASAYLMAHFEQ